MVKVTWQCTAPLESTSTRRLIRRSLATRTRAPPSRSRSASLLHASLERRGEHEGAARLCPMPIAPLYPWATRWAALLPSFPTHHASPSRTIQRTNYVRRVFIEVRCGVSHRHMSRDDVHTTYTRPNNAPLAIELAIAFPEALFPPCLIASASFSSFSWLKVCVSSSTRQASRCAASEESARSCRRRCKLREAQLDSQSTWPERPPPFADLRCRNAR